MKNVKYIRHVPNIKPIFYSELVNNLKNATHYYMVIPKRLGNIDIYSSKNLDPSIKVIFGDIYTMNVQGKLYYKSNITISETLGFSKYTVNKSIKFLKNHHWINIIYSKAPKHNLKKFIFINIDHFKSVEKQPTNKKRLHENQTRGRLKSKPRLAENHATLARKSSTNRSVNRSLGNRSMNRSDSASDANEKSKIKNQTRNQNLKQNQNLKKSRTNLNESKTNIKSLNLNKMHNKGLKPERKKQKTRKNSRGLSNALVGSKDYPSTHFSRYFFNGLNSLIVLNGRDINYTRKCCRQWTYCVDNHLIPKKICINITNRYIRLYSLDDIQFGRQVIMCIGFKINSWIKRHKSKHALKVWSKINQFKEDNHVLKAVEHECNTSSKKYDPKAYSYRLKNNYPCSVSSLKNLYEKDFPELKIVPSQYSAIVGFFLVDSNSYHFQDDIKKCKNHKYQGQRAVKYLFNCAVSTCVNVSRYDLEND